MAFLDYSGLSHFLDKIKSIFISSSQKGAVNGIASLDASGKVPSSQLPSYVDDVIEVATYNDLPLIGESGKIYVTLDTNKTYRWGGSAYVEISNPGIMTGATGSAAGTAGLVPAPAATDNVKYLKGDGTWANVPDPQDFTGATSQAAGTHGLVPVPSAGDEDKVLKGDGTWGIVDALPAVTSSDNGKVLEVSSGSWAVGTEKASVASPVFTGSISLGRKANTTVGSNSVAEGLNTTASNNGAHAEGGGTTASGAQSHAEGGDTIASGPQSHAEGYSTTASNANSHAEGAGAIASNVNSHAEGASATASGAQSHAEGNYTTASGTISHAEGSYTTALGYSEHASGTYNVLDAAPTWTASTSYAVGDKVKRTETFTDLGGTSRSRDVIYRCKTANSDSSFKYSKWEESGQWLEVVGNGTADNARSNVRTLDWEGNERLKGDIYVGCNADSTGGTKLTAPVAMTGATSSVAGTAGYVPAPAAGDQDKVLTADGTWKVAPGARVITVTGTVTNTSGSYSGTFNDNQVSADMKATQIELGTPSVFRDRISVTCNTGSVTVACNDVVGTSTISISMIKCANDVSVITSAEYDALNAAKTDKVASATNGNFASLDSNGNLTDSGHKHSDYLTSHQDITGKADKVSSATNGHFAGLDGNGNLTDSGKAPSDFVPSTDFYATEMPISSSDSTKVSAAISSVKQAVEKIDGSVDSLIVSGDLNTHKSTGVFRISNLSSCTNGPSGTGTQGILYVMAMNWYILQAFENGTNRASRLSFDAGSTWTDWQVVANNQAIANVNTTAVVTALTDIPVNTKGRIRLGASISPIGAELLVNYINVGSSTRQTIIVNSNTAGRTFVNSRTNDSTWTGWQELALKSDFVVEQKSSSSFNVGDGQTGNVSIAIAKTGYTPIGCVGITGTGSTGLAYSDWYISGTNLMIYYKNNLGQAKTGVVLKANMLYIKN